MKALITGANGQLGYELQRTAPEGYELFGVDVDQLDITQAEAVNQCFEQYQPDLLINAAAYTAVDRGEQDSETAYAVNAGGAGLLAQACADSNIPMVQVSTDFVFDGKQSTPYQPDDQPAPLSVYGASMQEGDEQVTRILAERSTIIRTAWVYSAQGNNFVKTMLRLMQEKEQLGIVADQIGTPTWAKTLAEACWKASEALINGNSGDIYHWTDAGVASWYDFAVAIQEEAVSLGLLDKSISIKPIPTTAYPTPATRPAFSVLNKETAYDALGMPPQHWRGCLREMLKEL